MRSVLALFSLVLACSQKQYIGPDNDSSTDGSSPLTDGAVVSDASADGAKADGGDEGGTPKAPQGFVSGSRLRVRYYQGSDGSEQRIGFYDNVRKEECYFGTASDGVTRCLPPSGNAAYTGLYTDSSCATPIAAVPKGCTATLIAIGSSTGSCPTYRIRILPLGSAYSSTTVWSLSGTTCTSGTIPSFWTTNYNVFSTGTEVTPSSFVDATTKTE